MTARKPNALLGRLGASLVEARRAAGLTQEDLAEASGYSVAYVSLLERGARNPPVLTLANLARALGVTSAQLVAGLPDPGSPAPTH